MVSNLSSNVDSFREIKRGTTDNEVEMRSIRVQKFFFVQFLFRFSKSLNPEQNVIRFAIERIERVYDDFFGEEIWAETFKQAVNRCTSLFHT